MKQVLCLFALSFFVLPILTTSKALANDPHLNNIRHYERRDGKFEADRSWDHRLGGFPAAPSGGNAQGAPSAPLDGGLSLLLAAGIGLGVKKAIERNKASKQPSGELAG